MSYAKARLSVQDFKDACHQWFLEILGYPRNRPAMARIAHLFPWNYWQSGKIDLKKAWETGGNWKMLGTRPANHPKVRLKQYLQLWHSNPSWMDDLLCFTKAKSMVVSSDLWLVRQFVKAWRNDILRGVFAQGKANTLWIDMAWPICCAFHQHNGETLWHNWPAGDGPRLYRHMARKAGWTDGTARHPLINAYVQCIIESLTVFYSQDES